MLLKPDSQQLNPLDFGYEQDDTSSNAIVPKNNSNIYPPISELIPSCNCKKCTTKACCCKVAGIECCSFCICQSKKTCANPYNVSI